MSLANVVRVSGRTEVRRMTIHTWPLMVGVPTVVGWGEVAGFDDRCHVNRGRRVSS